MVIFHCTIRNKYWKYLDNNRFLLTMFQIVEPKKTKLATAKRPKQNWKQNSRIEIDWKENRKLNATDLSSSDKIWSSAGDKLTSSLSGSILNQILPFRNFFFIQNNKQINQSIAILFIDSTHNRHESKHSEQKFVCQFFFTWNRFASPHIHKIFRSGGHCQTQHLQQFDLSNNWNNRNELYVFNKQITK